MNKVSFLFALLLSLVTFSNAASAKICAILYEHANYHGESLTVYDYSGTSPWIGDWWNDRASSVYVSPGCQITLYEHINFDGLPYTIYQTTHYFGDLFNDRTSGYSCSCN